MNRLDAVHEEMVAAVGLNEVLAAAFAAFTEMLPVIEGEQDPGSRTVRDLRDGRSDGCDRPAFSRGRAVAAGNASSGRSP